VIDHDLVHQPPMKTQLQSLYPNLF
jgi:hypothetical protein